MLKYYSTSNTIVTIMGMLQFGRLIKIAGAK